jgi:acetylornithine deacetylase
VGECRLSVAELLLDLVAIPSVSLMSNQPMVDYISARLAAQPWNIQFHPLADAAGMQKINMVACANTKNARAELALVCHTDTVPFAPEWTEAVTPQLRDGRIYGRGSCDVKGFLACVLAAVEDLDLNTLAKPLALVFTADEEVGCVGAKSLATSSAFSTRYTIIGEPTDLHPVRAGKGYALGLITVRGAEAHSAFPSKGHSAIYDAARVIASLEKIALELQRYVDPAFDPPYTTLNVGLIDGGKAKNIVPGDCRLTIEWQPIPGQDPQLVPQLILRELSTLNGMFDGFRAELEIHRLDPAFAPSDTCVMSELLASLAGTRASTISFGSEAAHLCNLASETVVFGPGDMGVAHKTGEFVEVAALEECVRILSAIIERTCVGAGAER